MQIQQRENKMKEWTIKLCGLISLLLLLTTIVKGERREEIYRLGLELERQASALAQDSYQHFKGWRGAISDQEQAILFKSEAFAASCRLFLRLTEERSDYFQGNFLRTNLYNAFIYLTHSFRELEKEMERGGIRPYALSNCVRILEQMDRGFSKWPSSDNLAYLHQKYVKAKDDTVYMIERKGPGDYVRHAFKNLESIYRYNYDLKREKDPWKYLVEVSAEILNKMEEGDIIDMNFDGYLIIERGNRPNRPVYLIENGKKRGLTSPRTLQRYGGWGKVFEVPAEVIREYPEGEPIK
jgi:hypothetical protein